MGPVLPCGAAVELELWEWGAGTGSTQATSGTGGVF